MRCIIYFSLFFLVSCTNRSDDSSLDNLTFDPKITHLDVKLNAKVLDFETIENGPCDHTSSTKLELFGNAGKNHLRLKWKKGIDENHYKFDELPSLKLEVIIDGEEYEFFISSKTDISDFSMFHTDKEVHHLKGQFILEPANSKTKDSFKGNPVLSLDVQKAQIKS